MDEDLRANEVDLVGQWLDVGNRIVGDGVTTRIEWLVAERLERIGADSSGWETLYRDPRDGRLWEHTHPYGEMHGGGPPRLSCIAPADAARKYPASAV